MGLQGLWGPRAELPCLPSEWGCARGKEAPRPGEASPTHARGKQSP